MVSDDPDDDRVLECAAAAQADYLLTGDKHLLKLGSYRATRIVKAAEFLALQTGPLAFLFRPARDKTCIDLLHLPFLQPWGRRGRPGTHLCGVASRSKRHGQPERGHRFC